MFENLLAEFGILLALQEGKNTLGSDLEHQSLCCIYYLKQFTNTANLCYNPKIDNQKLALFGHCSQILTTSDKSEMHCKATSKVTF
jgi:hypothetical protein